MKPFLKWAGGKTKLVPVIEKYLPNGARLIEPFAGSGAVFINLNYKNFIINDINEDLVVLYQYLKRDKKEFIDFCKSVFISENNKEEIYYEFRKEFNTTLDLRRKSQLFLYLNRHGYNGLCRYNRKGEYNVPFGRYEKIYFPEHEMHFFAEKSENAIFQSQSYEKCFEQAKKGDVMYCDPPYAPLDHAKTNFSTYATQDFKQYDQEKLGYLAERAIKKGVPVIISNHDSTLTRKIYQKAQIVEIEVARSINSDGKNRKKVKEILALYL